MCSVSLIDRCSENLTANFESDLHIKNIQKRNSRKEEVLHHNPKKSRKNVIKKKMSIEKNDSEDLNKIGWSFKEVCKFSKEIKPDNWCIVVSNDRIAFIEIKLSQTGPACLQKQLILSNYLQLEVYVGNNKLSDKVLNTSDINSVADLERYLATLGRFGTCLGNRNFHRTNKTSSQVKTEYWKHAQCLLLYEKNHTRKERCCDNCLSLNYFLTKKQRELVIPAVDEDDDDDEDIKPLLKRVKHESYVDRETRVKQEPLD